MDASSCFLHANSSHDALESLSQLHFFTDAEAPTRSVRGREVPANRLDADNAHEPDVTFEISLRTNFVVSLMV